MTVRAVQWITAVGLLTGVFASWDPIAGYDPGSDVRQHNRLDLDQQEIETYLKEAPPNFAKAKSIYENGAHSGAYARMTVASTPAALDKLAAVRQAAPGNTAAQGYMKKAYGTGVTSVDVTYESTCVTNVDSTSYDVTGCFSSNGAVTVGGSVSLGIPTAITPKYRTLKGFSTAAEAKMTGQVYFEKFKSYYTYGDYGDRYVMAALDGSGIFAGKDAVARVEGTKKGSAYMNVWMYVVREMEDAVADCNANCGQNCNDDPVHAWDEAVAFYSGTLEGTAAGGTSSGAMLHQLADKRCANFKTCTTGTTSGLSEVNREAFVLFKQGKDKLLMGKCSELRPIIDTIVKYMMVPLIQGSLRYAYKVGVLSGGSKEKAEGAVFSAAILPLVHSCSASAASTISNNMKIDSATPMSDGFAAVKTAFESTYSCLGVTCAQIGGLWSSGESQYYTGAGPCGEDEASHATGTWFSTGALATAAVASGVTFAGL